MIESRRLRLRPLEVSDEDDLFAYQSDPEIVRYIPWPARTREQVRAALAAYAGPRRLSEDGDAAVLAMVEKQSGRVIGQSNLGIESVTDRHASVGYVVGAAFAGRGFATEATAAMLDYAFDVLRMHRVSAQIDTRNHASAAVARKLGMRREAEFVENEWFKGAWSSSWIYAILEAEWMAVRDTMGHR